MWCDGLGAEVYIPEVQLFAGRIGSGPNFSSGPTFFFLSKFQWSNWWSKLEADGSAWVSFFLLFFGLGAIDACLGHDGRHDGLKSRERHLRPDGEIRWAQGNSC